MASAIPAARAALLSALKGSTDPAFEDVRIIDVGEWTEPLPQGARITVETSREIKRDWAGLGPALRLEETFVLVASIEILYAGRNLATVETKLWELVAAVERTVISDVTLGGSVRTARPDGSPEGEIIGPSSTGGAAAAIELRFACQQRIQLT